MAMDVIDANEQGGRQGDYANCHEGEFSETARNDSLQEKCGNSGAGRIQIHWVAS